MDKLLKQKANYVPLTPITFLKRAAKAYPNHASLVYETTSFTWTQTYRRCCSLASVLPSLGVLKNDVVSVLAPNIPALYEMHFAVPMAGAVLNPINTRLDAKNIAIILEHSEAKVFFVDYDYVKIVSDAIRIFMDDTNDKNTPVSESRMPIIVVIDDINKPTGVRLGHLEYEQLIRQGNPSYVPPEIEDEWDPIALNYTSGTTSKPKGVVYSHRGAYLSTLSLILGWGMENEPVYLWSLPMFHCNGWTFTWGVAARGGTNICIRNTTAYDMYRNIAMHKVTHMCCAPIVFKILMDAKPHEQRVITSPVKVLTGGAPPPAAWLERIEPLGFKVTHAYGLTEATGPALVCEWQAKWNNLPKDDQARLKARQGVSVLTLSDVDVKNDETMESVPWDGKSMGEIVLKGSSIMKGYFKDPEATSEAFRNGWFFTGDVGVIHPDGYLEIKDRSKDIIISGGENISSKDVEDVLLRHPRISEAAVVAMPHPVWGESPCAYVVLKENIDGKVEENLKEEEIITYCKKNLAGFMVPKKVVLTGMIPKNALGKALKRELRAVAKTIPRPEDIPSKKSTKVNERFQESYSYAQGHEQVVAMSRL